VEGEGIVKSIYILNFNDRVCQRLDSITTRWDGAMEFLHSTTSSRSSGGTRPDDNGENGELAADVRRQLPSRHRSRTSTTPGLRKSTFTSSPWTPHNLPDSLPTSLRASRCGTLPKSCLTDLKSIRVATSSHRTAYICGQLPFRGLIAGDWNDRHARPRWHASPNPANFGRPSSHSRRCTLKQSTLVACLTIIAVGGAWPLRCFRR